MSNRSSRRDGKENGPFLSHRNNLDMALNPRYLLKLQKKENP